MRGWSDVVPPRYPWAGRPWTAVPADVLRAFRREAPDDEVRQAADMELARRELFDDHELDPDPGDIDDLPEDEFDGASPPPPPGGARKRSAGRTGRGPRGPGCRPRGRAQTDRESFVTPPPPTAGIITAAHLRALRRELSLRYHPDRGGATEAMAAVNDLLDRLERVLGGPAGGNP